MSARRQVTAADAPAGGDAERSTFAAEAAGAAAAASPTSSPAPLRIAAVVPVLDEALAIGDVVRGLLAGPACCVLAVDGGSRDGTAEVAAAAGARVVAEPRRGYGRACRTGTEAALRAAPDGHLHDAVAFLDGDGSCEPADLPEMAAALGAADVVLGRRPRRLVERGAMPWHARAGNTLVAAMASVLLGRRVHDLPPTKIVRAQALRRLALDDDRFGWTTQLVMRSLADRGLAVREVAVRFRARRGGQSKVSGSWRASAAAACALVGTTLRERRPAPVLALMAKAPGAGHAKTRLARDLGDALTGAVWTACLADTGANLLAAAETGRLSPLAMVARPADSAPVQALLGRGWAVRVQRSSGLAGALGDVFLEAFDRGADRAIAVAGDNPTLDGSMVRSAAEALGRGPDAAVLGPTPDGGYHLVGLRWPAAAPWWPGLLRRRRRSRLEARLRGALATVPMGGASALAATREGLAAAGWQPVLGEPCPDIDTLDDLLALAPAIRRDPDRAPRLAAWLTCHQDVTAARSNQCGTGDEPAAARPTPLDGSPEALA